MSRLSIAFIIALCMCGGKASTAQAPGTTSFQISVPQKVAAGQLPIMQLKVTISLAAEPSAGTPVTFNITDPKAAGQTVSLTFNPAYVPVAGFPTPEREFTAPAAGLGQDIVLVTAPSAALPADDPGRKRYVFTFDLSSDFNPSASCANTMATATETWTIAVAAGSPRITGVCLQSFDRNIPGFECTGGLRLVPGTEPVASIVGGETGVQNCLDGRPALDVILVLDKSGSMSSSTLGGAPRPKIDALLDAAIDFVNEWGALRATETAPPADQIGIVFFDSNARWVNDATLPGGAWAGWSLGLNTFDAVKQASVATNIVNVTPGGATSIGDGLLEASDKLFDAANAGNGHRKVILLMSNGMENTDQRVRVNDPLNPTQVQTYLTATPAATPALPNQSNLQIYSVTVGTSTAVSADINEDMATATKGFYINTEDNAELLRPYFLELLQNFLKFNTYETVRMISGRVSRETPFSTTAPITTTSQSIAVNLMWNRNLGVLRLIVTPPGGAAPILGSGASGSSLVNRRLPLPPPFAPGGGWDIRVETLRTVGNAQEIPFDLTVMADDVGLNSDLSIAPADYAVGDNIRLQVRVTDFGEPVLNLGSKPTDRVIARLIKPDMAIGDLLSKSKAGTTPPSPSDPTTNANAKLFNELQSNPGALARNPDTVTLLDNGNPANGDEVAGDGIYSALYNASLAGHYDFLFGVEGATKNVGNFSRQQLKTVHVRTLPNAGATQFQTSVQGTGSGQTLVIEMTPRTMFGNLMGPGWGPYFWFTTPGRPPFKATDNLNGTFTARLPFTGATPPRVKVHFIRISSTIDETIKPEQLPAPLDDKTTFIDLPPAPSTKVCIQDDRSGDHLSFDTQTGEYEYVRCGQGGFTLTGKGQITREGCHIRLRDARVSADLDRCLIAPLNRGTATIKPNPVGTTFSIRDRDGANNTCVCP